jgi:hypothetical protein
MQIRSWIWIQLKILMRIRIQIQIRGGGGGRSAKNVHPPWQNPRYAPAYSVYSFRTEREDGCCFYSGLVLTSKRAVHSIARLGPEVSQVRFSLRSGGCQAAASLGSEHRLNMELDLTNIFGLHVQSCTHY